MKQIHTLLSALLISLVVCAASAPSSANAAPLQQSGSNATITTIQQRGSIVAGVKFDAPPFGAIDANGAVSGFEIDLLREFARRWLGDSDAVEFVQVTSANRIGRLLNEDIDLIVATMTITPERDEQIDFSQIYYLDGQNILVNMNHTPLTGDDAQRLQYLDGATIAAIQGSTSLARIQQFAIENRIAITVAEFEQYDQAVQPLIEGRINGLTTDRGILTGLAQQHPELAILLTENFSEEPYGIGVRPNDTAFVEQINQTLQAMKVDGTYDQIYARWFPGQQPYAFDETAVAAAPTATPAPIVTTVPPTATTIPAPTTTPISEPAAGPATLPTSGSSLRRIDVLPWLGLAIVLLFGTAIYRKRYQM